MERIKEGQHESHEQPVKHAENCRNTHSVVSTRTAQRPANPADTEKGASSRQQRRKGSTPEAGPSPKVQVWRQLEKAERDLQYNVRRAMELETVAFVMKKELDLIQDNQQLTTKECQDYLRQKWGNRH